MKNQSFIKSAKIIQGDKIIDLKVKNVNLTSTKKNFIKPVLSYYGSKFRLLPQIFKLLDLKKNDIFIDLFGGSGIVGINAKYKYNCFVKINDYDEILPIKLKEALLNILSFEGNQKNFTKARLNYFIKRLKNGWVEKLEKYNEILNKCLIVKNDFKKILKDKLIEENLDVKIYADPPYFGIKNLYNKSFELSDHFDLFNLLENLKYNTKIVISYNNCEYIKDLYKNWKIVEIEKTNVAGNSCKKVKELLITNG